VEGFIDRFAEFLRSLFADDESTNTRREARSEETRFRDPDVQDAWEELDEYMRTGANEAKRTRRAGESRGTQRAPDEALRPDYANLEVPFGADIETVKRSYKHLMLKYHPDKHSGNPEKQKIALDITKRINQSYERIRARHTGTS
jgi:DnaJ-domain-containing protein 1